MVEVASSSARRCISDRPRWYFLAVFALVYSLILQGMLASVLGAASASHTSLATLPAGTILCLPGQEDGGRPEAPAGQHDRHGETCCLSACSARLAGGPPPAAATPHAYPEQASLWQVPQLASQRSTSSPALSPHAARGPPPAA